MSIGPHPLSPEPDQTTTWQYVAQYLPPLATPKGGGGEGGGGEGGGGGGGEERRGEERRGEERRGGGGPYNKISNLTTASNDS